MKTNAEIGYYLYLRRFAAKMTQYQLGLALGYTGTVAKQMVYQWESGRRRIPPNKVKSLAKIISADPAMLLP